MFVTTPAGRSLMMRSVTAVALLLTGTLALAWAAPSETKKERETTADRIEFEARIQPRDPFAESNKIGYDKPVDVRRGELFTILVVGKPKKGFHTYPMTRRAPEQDETGLPTLMLEMPAGLRPVYPVYESEAKVVKHGPPIGDQLEFEEPFQWAQDVFVGPETMPGPQTVKVKIHLQVCSDKNCLWGDHVFDLAVNVLPDEPVAVSAELKGRIALPQPPITVVGGVRTPAPEGGPKEGGDTRNAGTPAPPTGLLGFALTGIFWGFVSLITPCVFPMIPITVSFFLKQSEKENHNALLMATVYCLTVVLVLTISAVALLSFFRELSTAWWMNFLIGGLLVFFALSLLGMYEIELPSGLANFTTARQAQGGYAGTIFMALTFTILSFACVAPFLGGFAATSNGTGLTWVHRVVGGLAFSATFAAPFFLFALFPTLLRKMPKSGNWLNSVKVVMGFLELAAAIKFLRAGELVLFDTPALFTYELSLGLFVALSILCGLYLLNIFRLPHDTPVDHLSVSRLLWSVLFISLGLYMLPGLFKDGARNQRPAGKVFAWLDSFLLPDEEAPALAAGSGGEKGGTELAWIGNLPGGLKAAHEQKKLVFVDFTGKTCQNCKVNEYNIFPRPEVQELLKQYQLVQLYTDIVPSRFYDRSVTTGEQRADAAANNKLQRERFGTEQLPLYLILEPTADGDFREVARYDEGLINNPARFAEFLRQPLQGTATAQASR